MKQILVCVGIALVGMVITGFFIMSGAISEGYGQKGDGWPAFAFATLTMITTALVVWWVRPRRRQTETLRK